MKSRKESAPSRDPHAGMNRLGELLAIALLGVLMALAGVAWSGLSSGIVSGQTVPRTPPPTFTATPSITPRVTPTDTPLPTSTATFVPGQPTPTPQPNPLIELQASPSIVGPGDVVSYRGQVVNHGGAPARGAQISLEVPSPLSIQEANASMGILDVDGHVLRIGLDALYPGEAWTFQVHAAVQPDALPGQAIVSRASLVYEQGVRESGQVTIHLPPALLPATGGD